LLRKKLNGKVTPLWFDVRMKDRVRQQPKQGKSSPAAAFPKWLIVMVIAAGLIALNLFFFQRKLLVAFKETKSSPSASTNEISQKTGPGVESNSGTQADSSSVSAVGAGSSLAGLGAETDRDKALNLFTRGTELLEQRKLTEAIEKFEASLRLDPESEDTHYNLAFALAKLGRTEDAIREYKEALRILPDYAEAHNNLGNLFKNQGKLDEAIQHFNAALKIIPDHPSARNNLGVALAQQGKIHEATLHFAKAIELQPDYVDAHYNLGSAYVSQGRLDEAVTEFTAALRIQPNFQPAGQALMKVQQTRALQRSAQK